MHDKNMKIKIQNIRLKSILPPCITHHGRSQKKEQTFDKSPQFGWKVLIVASTGLQVQVTLPIKRIKINYHIQLLPLCKTRIDGQKLWNSVLSKVQLLPFAERGHSNGEHPHKRTSMKERVVYQWPLQLNRHTRRKGQ